MASAAPGPAKKRSRIPVRVWPRPKDVNSPICRIQRTLEAMNIDCAKDVPVSSQTVARLPDVSSTAGASVWWNTTATISWASGLDTSTPLTFSAINGDHPTTSTFTPVSTPNFTPLHRGNIETPDCTPVLGDLLRRAATQHPINQHSHMNMVTPGLTPVVSNGVAGQCWSTSGKQVKTSTPCWMMEKTSSISSLSSSDLVLPTPPSSIKRPCPYPVLTQDSMEYIQADSCPPPQRKLPRRRLTVVGEESPPPPECVQTPCVDTMAAHDHDLGVSTLGSSTHDNQSCCTLPGLGQDKEIIHRHTALVCATPTPGPEPATCHLPADISNVKNVVLHLPLSMPSDGSMEKSDCSVTQSPASNCHIPNHFQLKGSLVEDQLLGKKHCKSCVQNIGVSSEYRNEDHHHVKRESTSNQEYSYTCHVLSQRAPNVGSPKSADGPQNCNTTSGTGQPNVTSQGQHGETGPLVSTNSPPEKPGRTKEVPEHIKQPFHGRRNMYLARQDNKTHAAIRDSIEDVKAAFLTENGDIPSVQRENGLECGSDSPPPVKVCRLSQPTDATLNVDPGNNSRTVTGRYNIQRNPPLACLRNSETFNVLQNWCMGSSSDDVTTSTSTAKDSPIDSSSESLHGIEKVSFPNFKQLSDARPNLTATFADSALGLSVSSFDTSTDSHLEEAHGVSSIPDTVMTEEEGYIMEETASNTNISGRKVSLTEDTYGNDLQQEQLLTDFKENMKLSKRRVHFKLSPEKHPAPPQSPSNTGHSKTMKHSPKKQSKKSPRKSPRKNSPQKCSSPLKLRFSPVKLRSSPGKRCSPSKLQISTGRSRASPGKRHHPSEVNKVRKSLLGDFGSMKTPATIKRKLFTRDLPRREAWSSHDTAEVVMETEAMNDSGLSLSLFVLNEHQPGSKLGWDYVDIFGELTHVYNMPMIVESILAYLDPSDLSSICCVSKEWNQVCMNDRKAEQCREKYLRQRRRLAPRVGKENLIKWRSRDEGGLTDTNTALATLQLQHVLTPKQATPSMSRHDQFSKLARLLPHKHYLTPCIRCRSPAHVFPKHHRAMCQQDSCKFDYCLHCNCVFHGDVPCPALTPITSPTPMRGKKVRSSPVAGSKGSKRRLRRL
ncbi:mucin-17-like [Branchiostoma lanceolatum]|uniref:mucin-17-like n=1 Tax=Branchiostoma lanceolatum TaxID=7740 RepID=UPI00345379D2